MTIPTRFIEQSEFSNLIKLEGGTLPLYKLAAIPFGPPSPEHPQGAIDYDNYKTVRIMILNVSEPRLYRDEKGIVFVVYPSVDTIEYSDVSDMHPNHDEWCYRFSAYSWDETYDLEDATYFFRDRSLSTFDPSDVFTH